MRLQGIRKQDLERLDEIYREHHEDDFGVPSLSNTITSASAVEGDKIIGYGLVKILAEATMVLDLNESVEDRLEAMKLLMHEAIRACVTKDIKQLHVFVKDKKLVRLLHKKYGFNEVSGTTMVLEV